MSLGHTDTKSNFNEISKEGHSSFSEADNSSTVDIARIIYEFRDYDYLVTAKFKFFRHIPLLSFHFYIHEL